MSTITSSPKPYSEILKTEITFLTKCINDRPFYGTKTHKAILEARRLAFQHALEAYQKFNHDTTFAAIARDSGSYRSKPSY